MQQTRLERSLAIPGESKHMPELDGVRGIAILAVLVSHGVDFLHVVPRSTAWGLIANRALLPLWGGVDLFFTLSGFLITGILLRSRSKPTYFRSFYARRALRIFPIYYAYVIFQLCLGWLWRPFGALMPHTLHERVSYFLYIQNWPVFWASWAGLSSILAIYWSLAVEEQFYMVWPTVVRFLSPQVLFGICIFGFLLGAPERYGMIRHLGGLQLGIIQWPFSRLDGLFLGAALALYQHIFGRRVPKLFAGLLFSMGVVGYGWIVIFHTAALGGAGISLWTVGIASFALMSAGLVAAAQHRPAWLHRILTVRPLVAAGTYSYGMYVYHLSIYILLASCVKRYVYPVFGDRSNPIVALIIISFAISIVSAIAYLSFRFFEKPILALKRYFPSPSAPV